MVKEESIEVTETSEKTVEEVIQPEKPESKPVADTTITEEKQEPLERKPEPVDKVEKEEIKEVVKPTVKVEPPKPVKVKAKAEIDLVSNPDIDEESPIKPVVKRVKSDVVLENKSYKRDEVLKKVTSVIDENAVSKFYSVISDDLQALEIIEQKINSNNDLEKDLKKIKLILSITSKHPILKEIKDIQLIFIRSLDTFRFILDNFDNLDKNLIVPNAKDLLNCLRKDNKLDDYSKIFETINKIGLIHHKLSQGVTRNKVKQSNQMDRIRKKIAEKEIISTQSILDSIVKQKDK